MAGALQDAIQQLNLEGTLVELPHHAPPAENLLEGRHGLIENSFHCAAAVHLVVLSMLVAAVAVTAEAELRRLGHRRIADIAVWLRLGGLYCGKEISREPTI